MEYQELHDFIYGYITQGDKGTFTLEDVFQALPPTSVDSMPKKAVVLRLAKEIAHSIEGMYYCPLTSCYRRVCDKTYYVGDLCYVLEGSFDKIIDYVHPTRDVTRTGKMPVFGDKTVYLFNTRYGDGVFYLTKGTEYVAAIAVDSGSIGLCPADMFEKHDRGLGAKMYIEDLSSFACVADENSGVMKFGPFTVRT
jgi:hypothetical protein